MTQELTLLPWEEVGGIEPSELPAVLEQSRLTSEPSSLAGLAPRPGRKLTEFERQQEELKAIEDDMFRKSSRVVSAALDFMDVDPQNPDEAAQRWRTSGLSEGEVQARLRVASSAWLPAANAPVGIKNAQAVAAALVKARANGQQPTQLNVAFVKMVVAPEILDAITVDD